MRAANFSFCPPSFRDSVTCEADVIDDQVITTLDGFTIYRKLTNKTVGHKIITN